jgi:hypothetical protein
MHRGTTVEAIKEALERHRVAGEELKELEDAEKVAEKIVQRPLNIDWDDMASLEGIG